MKLSRLPVLSVWLLLVLFISGCGSSGEDLVVTPSTPPSEQTATVELRSVLAQSVVPSGVTTLRASGYDQEQALRYGPTSFEKATVVQWTGVPVEVTDFVVEYLDAQGKILGLTQISVQLSSGETLVLDNPTVLEVSGALERITIAPATGNIAKGTSTEYTAIGIFSDGTTQEVTSAASWSSADSAVATVSKGRAEGKSVGNTTITATLAGVSAQADLVVSDATLKSLVISPDSPAIALGTSQEFSAEGFFSDGSFQDLTDDVVWSSSDVTVAEIVDGTAQAGGGGQTTITATLGGISDDTVLTVTPALLESLTVEGGASSIALGTSTEFTARGHFSDNTTQDLSSLAVWEVQPSTKAGVNKGRVIGRETGTATVSATFGGKTGQAAFEVTDAEVASVRVETVPAEGSTLVNVGQTLSLRAVALLSDEEDRNVTGEALWTSDDDNIATVVDGMVTGVAPGQTFIKAEFNGFVGKLQVTVQEGPLPQLVLSGNVYTFDTDAGVLSPQVGNSATAPGWNPVEQRLVLQSFTLENGATLNLTGTNTFKVKAKNSITIGGLLNFRGQDGTPGTDGTDPTSGTDGGNGENGGNINLFSSGDITVTGTINVNGGNGGDAGGYSSDGSNMATVSGGLGGRGGDSGKILLSAGDNLEVSLGELFESGGNGGRGGSVTIAVDNFINGILAGGDGGQGGRGVTQGGQGGNGGSVTISGDNIGTALAGAGGKGGKGGVNGGAGGSGGNVNSFTNRAPSIGGLLAGLGGDGGEGGTLGGQGGDGGKITIDTVNTGDATGGAGGSGGRGGAQGGDGGAGGDVSVVDNAVNAIAGDGGNGGDGDLQGGNGGDGGNVTIPNNFGVAEFGSGGIGGSPGGVNGTDGTVN